MQERFGRKFVMVFVEMSIGRGQGGFGMRTQFHVCWPMEPEPISTN